MEQRRQSRFSADQVVPVTILGDPEIQRTGIVKNASGRGLGLEMAFPVSIGAALQIHLPDAVLLGEAMYCRGQNGRYFVGVELEQALFGLSQLSEAFGAFAEDLSGMESAHTVVERRR
ncbi:MAG TPA: hypothetical protein VNY05_44165 [Candidatus Acidoferrales bacterium]|jgi:hypothetical protein|nr:hypothetical protein [Candidatus Acidoferrales bacterium]